MAKGLFVWLDSGANIHSCNRQFLTWDELGISEEEYDAMDDDAKVEFCKDVAFEDVEWGFNKADAMPDDRW